MGTFANGESGSSVRTKINAAIQKTEGTSAISTIDVDGGAIDGVTIGTNSAVTDLRVDNLQLDGNTVSSTNLNGDITIDPNGTGDVNIGNFKFDADQTIGAGQDNYVLTYDNAGGKISLEAAAGGGGGGADLYAANESSPIAQPSATGTNAIAIGDSASSTGTRSVAIGTGLASNTDSFAAAIATTNTSYGAKGANSVSLGFFSRATQTESVALNGYAQGLKSISIGSSSHATSTYGCAVGYDTTAVGSALALGVTANAQAAYSTSIHRSKAEQQGKIAFSGAFFSTAGDAQGGSFVLLADTTDATATVLTANNGTPSSLNQIIANSDTCITFTGTVVAMQNGAQSYGGFKIEGLLVNDGGTTSLAASTVTAIQNTSGWTVALSADDTNDALAITVTGEAAHNIRWVANISTSEVTYA